jgi:hypothetical protein
VLLLVLCRSQLFLEALQPLVQLTVDGKHNARATSERVVWAEPALS